MRLLIPVSIITILLIFALLYLASNTVGRHDYLSREISAEKRPLFSFVVLCLDNPLAKLVIINLKITSNYSNDSIVVSGNTIFGWHVVTINILGVEDQVFDSCTVTWR